MKKIIALAVASAFVVPAFAADVAITGSMENFYQDSNGTTKTEIDGAVVITASSELNNGLTIAADFNISDTIGDDGGNTLKLSGPFGSVDVGDAAGAIDSVDGIVEFQRILSTGSLGGDAGVTWALPAIGGASVFVSYVADSNTQNSAQEPGNEIAVKYDIAGISLRYGMADNDDATEETYIGATYSMQGLTVAIENHEDKAADATTTEKATVGVKYNTGDLTLAITNRDTKTTASGTTADVTAYSVEYSLGGGAAVFYENSSDSKTATEDKQVLGLAYKF